MNNEEKKAIFNYAYKYLLEVKPEGLSEEDIKIYLEPDADKDFNKDIKEVMKNMILSLQNYQSMPNVISFEKRMKRFGSLLFDFDPHQISSKYTEDTLHQLFYDEFLFKNKESRRNLWRKWTKGIISGSRFLSEFKTGNEFHDFCQQFSFNKYTKASLPMLLEKEINGMGFALACDFLKELGYHDYPKPDVHLIEIFNGLGLSIAKDKYEVFKDIVEFAQEVNATPYKVDKIFWLIASGRYYEHDIKIRGRKEEFISEANKYINSFQSV